MQLFQKKASKSFTKTTSNRKSLSIDKNQQKQKALTDIEFKLNKIFSQKKNTNEKIFN